MPHDLKKLAKTITADQGRMVSKRQPRESRTKRINEIFRPDRVDLDNTRQEGDEFSPKIYYHKPQLFLFQWTNAFSGATSSKRLDWFHYGFTVEFLNNLDSAQIYFQEAREQMRNAFERSNFYDESLPYINDAGADGNAFMEPIHDLDLNQAMFRTEHPGDVWISRDKYGKVNRVHVKKKMTAEQAYSQFKDNEYQGTELKGNLPADLIANATEANGSPLTEYEFIHARWENPDPRMDSLLSEDKEFLNAWVCASNTEIVELNGVDEIILEWTPNRSSRNVYGTGLAAFGLNAALTGDSYALKQLKMTAVAAEPRWKGSKTVRSRFDRRPNGVTWLDAGEDIEQINERSSYPTTKDQMDEFDDIIEDWFMLKLFLAVSSIENPKDVTATYLNQLQGEKAQVLTSTVTGYEMFLDKVHEFVWTIEDNAGRMPPMPQELIDEIAAYENANPGSEVEIKPNYIGPLFQIQREFLRTAPIQKGLDMIDRIAEKFPASLTKIDGDKLMEEALDGVGFQEKIQRSDDEVEAIRAAEAAALAEQQQRETMAMAAENTTGLDKTIEPDSVLDKVLNA